MKIEKKYKLWEATEKNSWRPVFEHIFFQDGHAYATDGHLLVKVPLESIFEVNPGGEPEDQISLLNGYCIHANVLKKVFSYGQAWVEKEGDNVQFIVYFQDQQIRISLKKTEDMNPPKFESVLDNPGTTEPVSVIGLNAKLLSRLTNAMGISEKIRMQFTKSNGKIFVEPLEEFYRNTMRGVIMPIYVG